LDDFTVSVVAGRPVSFVNDDQNAFAFFDNLGFQIHLKSLRCHEKDSLRFVKFFPLWFRETTSQLYNFIQWHL
jgi:hypothetical protein